MKITIHLGAHRTDGDRLMKTLMRNNTRLSRHGIFVPGPSRYRTLLRQVTQRLNGAVANPETLDFVLDALMDTTEAEHVVLSDASFLCAARHVFDQGAYYAEAGQRCLELRNLFPGHKVRFALALRNPATQVPDIFSGLDGSRYADFLNGADPLDWNWVTPVAAIREAVPDAPLIVWCNEDTPLIWADILRAVAIHPPEMRAKGALDLLASIMKEEGMERMKKYIARHPPENDAHKRRIYSAFLNKYAKEDAVESVIDLPGWDAELVDSLTEAYEEDVAAIRKMPGVAFLEP